MYSPEVLHDSIASIGDYVMEHPDRGNLVRVQLRQLSEEFEIDLDVCALHLSKYIIDHSNIQAPGVVKLLNELP